MSNKLTVFLGAVILLISQVALSQENFDNSVPPIQYPEKRHDEMQVRKDIKNSFINNDEPLSSLNSLNTISPPNNETKQNLNNGNLANLKNETEAQSDVKSQKTFDDLIGQTIAKKKNENSKKNMNIVLKENEQPSRQSELWKVFLISSFFVCILGFLGFILTKFKKKGFIFSNNKNEKMMDIISTLPISPKRQVMILKIRDQEIVVSNTEAGIQFLTEINSNYVSRNYNERKQVQISDKFILPKNNEKLLTEKSEVSQYQQTEKEKLGEKKSDILLRALKSINSNTLGQKKSTISENNSLNTKGDSFPKYLANQFENEGKKEVKKRDEDVDSVENVTNLIREKLRSMKPLN